MKEVRFFYVPDAEHQLELPSDEAQHAAKVLRLQPGDEVFLMDGEGAYYRSELTLVSQKHCMYEIKEKVMHDKAWHGTINLAIAPTKNIDRIEWLVEKATEIGWDSVSFLDCRFSERRQLRTDRIEKIVVSAVKQSHKPFMPKVNEMTSFTDYIHSDIKGKKFICHCYDEIEKQDLETLLKTLPEASSLPIGERQEEASVTILVGPEGDFSIDEVRQAIDAGFISVTLGDFRLRTETAGLVAVTMSQLAMRR